MNLNIMETVLNEILEELKLSNANHAENKAKLAEFGIRLEAFEQLLKDQKIIIPPVDTTPIQKIITDGIAAEKDAIKAGLGQISEGITKDLLRMDVTIASQDKPVVRQWRILLYPEQWSREYYKLISGRIILLLLSLVGITYLYFLGRAWVTRPAEHAMLPAPAYQIHPPNPTPASPSPSHPPRHKARPHNPLPPTDSISAPIPPTSAPASSSSSP